MEKKQPSISVVIPVYKAEECIDELYKRLTASLEKIDRVGHRKRGEVVRAADKFFGV